MACIFTRRSQKIEIAEARAHVCAHEERRVKYFHKMKKCCAAHLGTKCAAISTKQNKTEGNCQRRCDMHMLNFSTVRVEISE